jgi:hypothetical protein
MDDIRKKRYETNGCQAEYATRVLICNLGSKYYYKEIFVCKQCDHHGLYALDNTRDCINGTININDYENYKNSGADENALTQYRIWEPPTKLLSKV